MGWIWAVVLILIAAELGAVAWVRRDRYPRFIFNRWAPALYALMVLADLLLGMLLTWAVGGGSAEAVAQANAMLAWAVGAGLVAVVAALLALFFRWILRGDMPE